MQGGATVALVAPVAPFAPGDAVTASPGVGPAPDVTSTDHDSGHPAAPGVASAQVLLPVTMHIDMVTLCMINAAMLACNIAAIIGTVHSSVTAGYLLIKRTL